MYLQRYGIDNITSALPKNPKTRWSRRVPEKEIHGLVIHQSLCDATIEAIAKYHISPECHINPGVGAPSFCYTFAITKDGHIWQCNDLEDITWSQGDASRPGDENREFISVCVIGYFTGVGVAGGAEPTPAQITSVLRLYEVLQAEQLVQLPTMVFGHYHFGKPSCPGYTLSKVIESVRAQAITSASDFGPTINKETALVKLGYLGKSDADDCWGVEDRAALVKFQRTHPECGRPDGVWGPKTDNAILMALRAKEPAKQA